MLKGLSTRLSKYIGFGSGQWVRKRIVDPFLQILRRGAEPKQLAFSGAVGITLGVFPICGILIFQLNCYRKLNILRLDAEMKKGKLIEFISTVTQLLNSSLTARQNYFSENSVCYIRSAGITKGVRNISSCIF
ncbi:Hypothetical predicted protein [Olea europaea subsp. europaea]|uniref:Uncharacterized protein n=1 Tax=Olea europaea subsp. europaea TaxID=158383 RepID=A0A8S0TFU3_OLEEU|nr:Hypothetical predicted protein [Olea europaea subsp. europaea]